MIAQPNYLSTINRKYPDYLCPYSSLLRGIKPASRPIVSLKKGSVPILRERVVG
jgi:hypothetical protein